MDYIDIGLNRIERKSLLKAINLLGAESNKECIMSIGYKCGAETNKANKALINKFTCCSDLSDV